MRFITRAECFSELNLKLSANEDDLGVLFSHQASVRVSERSKFYVDNRILSTYRVIFDEINPTKDSIAAFDNIGVWPSLWDKNLSQIVWSSYGQINIVDRPGIIFGSKNREDIITLLCLSFYSGWDSVLFFGKDDWIFFSHDDFGYCKFSDSALERFIEA